MKPTMMMHIQAQVHPGKLEMIGLCQITEDYFKPPVSFTQLKCSRMASMTTAIDLSLQGQH